MKATKYTITVTVEVLSIDSAPALLNEVAESMKGENTDGNIHKADGDEVSWKTKSKKVEF